MHEEAINTLDNKRHNYVCKANTLKDTIERSNKKINALKLEIKSTEDKRDKEIENHEYVVNQIHELDASINLLKGESKQ